MLLSELTLPPTVQHVDDKLLANGWAKIGDGYYATVYGKSGTSYVLKVFERDSAYVDFLKMIAQHPNPHFPKIRGRLRVTEAYHAVRMEKLFQIPQYGVGEEKVNVNGMMSAYLIDKSYRLNYFQKKNLVFFNEYIKENPRLIEALDLIHDNLLDHHSLDLNKDNVMQRGDGTPVIIDPIC